MVAVGAFNLDANVAPSGDREEQAKAFSDKVRNMVETGQSRSGGV